MGKRICVEWNEVKLDNVRTKWMPAKAKWTLVREKANPRQIQRGWFSRTCTCFGIPNKKDAETSSAWQRILASEQWTKWTKHVPVNSANELTCFEKAKQKRIVALWTANNPRQRIYGRNEIPDSEQIERTGRSPKVKFCERRVNPRQRILASVQWTRSFWTDNFWGEESQTNEILQTMSLVWQ